MNDHVEYLDDCKNGRQLLRPSDVAIRLACSTRQVYSLIKEGRLDATRPSYKTLRVYADSVERYIEQGRL